MPAGSQSAGVAVGIDAGVGRQQVSTQLAHALVGRQVFLVNGLCICFEGADQRRAGKVAGDSLQTLKGPEQIDGRRAAGGKGGNGRRQRCR